MSSPRYGFSTPCRLTIRNSARLFHHEILVSAQGPLVLGFRVWGLGVWGEGLTIFKYSQPRQWH